MRYLTENFMVFFKCTSSFVLNFFLKVFSFVVFLDNACAEGYFIGQQGNAVLDTVTKTC